MTQACASRLAASSRSRIEQALTSSSQCQGWPNGNLRWTGNAAVVQLHLCVDIEIRNIDYPVYANLFSLGFCIPLTVVSLHHGHYTHSFYLPKGTSL